MDQSPRPGASLSLYMGFISNTSLDRWYRFLWVRCRPTSPGCRFHGLRLYIYPYHRHYNRCDGSSDVLDWTGQFTVYLLDGEDDQNLCHLSRLGFDIMCYCSAGESCPQARFTLRLHWCQLDIWLESCGLLFPLWLFVGIMDHDRLRCYCAHYGGVSLQLDTPYQHVSY